MQTTTERLLGAIQNVRAAIDEFEKQAATADFTPSFVPNRDDDALWGVIAIGQAIGLKPRQTYHLLESGRLPAKKIGSKWVTSKQVIQGYMRRGLEG